MDSDSEVVCVTQSAGGFHLPQTVRTSRYMFAIENQNTIARRYTVALLILSLAIAFVVAFTQLTKTNLGPMLGGTALIMLVAFTLLNFTNRRRDWTFCLSLKTPIFVQAGVQISILAFMSFHSEHVGNYAALMVYQTVFAFALDVLLSLFFFKSYRLSGSILPIVFSINLFMWFRPEFFHWQLAVITLGVCSKYLLCRKANGTRSHIFNPSAIAMAAAICFLIPQSPSQYLYLREIIESYNQSRPGIFWFILLVGLITQGFGRVYLISLGALLTLFFTSQFSILLTGMPLTNQWIDPSVMVGTTLLVTDPATSPKTSRGKFYFGIAYGISIILAYAGLSLLQAPGYFAKIMAVPLLNFLVPYFDRSKHAIAPRLFTQGLLYFLVALILISFAYPKRRASLLGKLGGEKWSEENVR